jgi:hypothetical protein
MANEFMGALQKARLELAGIDAEQKRLAQRKAQLLETIKALAPLLTPQPSLETLKLADAIRTVIGSYELNQPRAVLTPKSVRELLKEMGFDFSRYSENYMAAIHTAMRRMVKSGELEAAGDAGFGGGYRVKAGSTLDPNNAIYVSGMRNYPHK